MKRKGLAHAVILGGLLAFVILFLSTFLWTCFQIPLTVPPQEGEKLIPITTLEREAPSIPGFSRFVKPPSVQFVEELPPVVEALPSIQERESLTPMPPPEPLIWLPHVTEMIKIPAISRSLTVSSKLYIPDVPFLFEPRVLSEEEYDMFFPVILEP